MPAPSAWEPLCPSLYFAALQKKKKRISQKNVGDTSSCLQNCLHYSGDCQNPTVLLNLCTCKSSTDGGATVLSSEVYTKSFPVCLSKPENRHWELTCRLLFTVRGKFIFLSGCHSHNCCFNNKIISKYEIYV